MTTRLKVITHNGEVLVDMLDYDPISLEERLNDREILMVAIGDAVINKNSIIMISPEKEELTQ